METVPVSAAQSSPGFIVSSVCVRTRGDVRRGKNSVNVKQGIQVGIKRSELHQGVRAPQRGKSTTKGYSENQLSVSNQI